MPEKVYFGGAYTDPTTVDLLRELQRVTGETILLTQGSYSTTVSASAGTHDGGGCVDINTYGWSSATIWNVLDKGRCMGAPCWYRTQAQGFSPHIHLLRADCADLSPSARAQNVQYLNGENGLAGHGADDGPRNCVGQTWARYKSGTAYRPPIDTDGTSEEDDMTPDQAAQLKDVHAALPLIRDLHNAMSALGGTGNADRFRPFFRRASVEGTYDVAKSEGNLGLGAKLDKIMAKLGI